MTSFEDLSPRQKRLLEEVFPELKGEIPVPDARLMLEAKSNNNLLLTNPHLQPIAFAVKHVTWKNYVYGVIWELFAWANFFFFSLLLLLTTATIMLLMVFALFKLHLQALKQLKETLPRLHEKLKEIEHKFERRRWSAQRRRYNAYQKLCADTRAPVLYLRSFSFDFVSELPLEVTRKTDERLAEHYEQYGPVIAVAGPDDKGYMHGPVRLYFDDDIWRAGVIYLMSISQLVIVQAGISQGTLWELAMARRLLEPDKLIISIASASNPNVADTFYDDFKKYAEVILGCKLPESLGSSVHLGFGKGWKSFPQDPRILMGQNDEWLAVKAAERRRTRQTYKGVLKTEAATGHSCEHGNKKSFDWLEGWNDAPACEHCGAILKIARSGGHERELYQKLLSKAFGDKAQVERLIEVEKRKKPGAGRAVWMKNAIDRWEKGNR